MKESVDPNNEEKREGYTQIIHNYLMCLYLEDYKEEELYRDITDR